MWQQVHSVNIQGNLWDPIIHQVETDIRGSDWTLLICYERSEVVQWWPLLTTPVSKVWDIVVYRQPFF